MCNLVNNLDKINKKIMEIIYKCRKCKNYKLRNKNKNNNSNKNEKIKKYIKIVNNKKKKLILLRQNQKDK